MKLLKRIFVLIFLSGMLFTVFTYIPLIEEETPHHKVDLKKQNSQGSDGGDQDADPDDDAYEQVAADLGIGRLATANVGYVSDPDHYDHLADNRWPQPPEV